MKNVLMGAVLVVCAQCSFALMLEGMPLSVATASQSSMASDPHEATSNEATGEEWVKVFGETMKQNRLYSLLLPLDSEVPLATKNAKYVVMLREVHHTNVLLTQLLLTTQKNNQLLEQWLSKQGSTYG